ncbi:MAG: hypothetical protein JXL97_19165 [Bacteroidales bacterium]|nr:hypothetical protein [Bacteroidales bacterium]
MRKLISIVVFVLFISSSVIFAQNKSIFIYTLQSEAEFIPFINGRQMTMIPVDSFFIDADTIQFLRLDIHFLDDQTANISKKIDFDFFKHKKYEIIYKSNFLRTLNDVGNGSKSDTLYDKFKIKNHSAMSYFGDVSSID